MTPTEQRWIDLALTFPCLAEAKGDWLKGRKEGPVAELAAWLENSPAVTSGGEHAAKLMLGIWNYRNPAGGHTFDLHRAVNAWDNAHLRAFNAWAQEPWYA
jgi:hypothetical protein